MQLLLATRNRHKVKELTTMLADLDLEIFTANDIPGLPKVVEDAPTIRENAIKKAVACAAFAKRLTLADDSGLEVDALNGEPGVHSARFAGEGASDLENNRKLIALLHGLPWEKRSARFRCVVAIADTSGLVEVVEGVCNGVITDAERGGGGFGYDPLFIPDGQVKTFAELAPDVKNRISHRARAMTKAIAALRRYQRTKAAAH